MKKWTEKKLDDYSMINVEREFSIQIHDYDRPGYGLLIASGFGLGMALMDILPQCRYFFDIDNYRNNQIDWECLGIRLSFAGLRQIILVGWFTVDSSTNFDNLARGILIDKLIYRGGSESLKNFVHRVHAETSYN